MEVVGLVGKIIREEKPARVNIDVGGMGVGVYDRLMELGQGQVAYGYYTLVDGVVSWSGPMTCSKAIWQTRSDIPSRRQDDIDDARVTKRHAGSWGQEVVSL